MTGIQAPTLTDDICAACKLGQHAKCWKLISHRASGRRGHHSCRCGTCRPIVAS